MTPDNAAYFHAAYVIGLGLYAGYILLLRWRERSLDSRERAADDIEARTSARAAGDSLEHGGGT